MEKNEVCNYLNKFEKNSIHKLIWDRGNGNIERLVAFEGFDPRGNPKLHLGDSGNYLDILLIGGYFSIISIQEECPDGFCPGRIFNQEEPDGMC
jgi:hypothetical protein